MRFSAIKGDNRIITENIDVSCYSKRTSLIVINQDVSHYSTHNPKECRVYKDKFDNLYISATDISFTKRSEAYNHITIQEETDEVMKFISGNLAKHNFTFADVICTTIYVKKMSDFSLMNSVYGSYFDINPPSRITVEANLDYNVQIDIVASKSIKKSLHVQGFSYWAPANIGPYSQAKETNVIYMAGQIGLIPYNMLLGNSFLDQLKLSLQNLHRVSSAMNSSLGRMLQCVCYMTNKSFINQTKVELMKFGIKSHFVIVPGLPRNAFIEWATIFAPYNTPKEEIILNELIYSSYSNSLILMERKFDSTRFISGNLMCSTINIQNLKDGIKLLIDNAGEISTLRIFHLQSISSNLISDIITEFGYCGCLTCVPVIDLEGYLTFIAN